MGFVILQTFEEITNSPENVSYSWLAFQNLSNNSLVCGFRLTSFIRRLGDGFYLSSLTFTSATIFVAPVSAYTLMNTA